MSRVTIEEVVEDTVVNSLNNNNDGDQHGMVIFGSNIDQDTYYNILKDKMLIVEDVIEYSVLTMKKEENRIISNSLLLLMLIIAIVIMYKLRVFR